MDTDLYQTQKQVHGKSLLLDLFQNDPVGKTLHMYICMYIITCFACFLLAEVRFTVGCWVSIKDSCDEFQLVPVKVETSSMVNARRIELY